jgi:hypothetical protein
MEEEGDADGCAVKERSEGMDQNGDLVDEHVLALVASHSPLQSLEQQWCL